MKKIRNNRIRQAAVWMLSAVLFLMPAAASASENTAASTSSAAQTSTAADTDTSRIPLTNLLPGWPQADEINEESGVVMDADSGAVLYSLNRNDIRYPASTTKIMTALLVIENASLSDTVTMTAEGLVHTTDGSTNANTVAGEEFTVEQCLYIMLLKSANDIAVQLSVHVAGSVSAFSDMMNERAAAIGCENTHFVNPSGMPDTDHYTTADDMAKIMRECLKNETFRTIISTKRYTVPATNKNSEERIYDNHNLLIQPTSEYYYEYAIGGKTGFTKAAWRTLVTAAEKDGRTLICVVMRGPDKTDFVDSKNLFEYGFNNFSDQMINGVRVTLPNSISADQVEQVTTELGDGTVRIDSYYSRLPVGSAVLRGEEAITAESSINAGESAEVDSAEVENTRGTHIPTWLLIIVLIALAVGVVFAAMELKSTRES